MENFLFFSNNTIGGGIITFRYRYRKQIFIGLILFFFIIFLLSFGIYRWIYSNQNSKKDEVVSIKKENDSISKKEESKEEDILYRVDIKGEVRNAGIYSVSPSSRVIDVIMMADGLTENADTSVINLSKKVWDEMVIIIYSHEEVQNFYQTKEKEEQQLEKCIQKDDFSLKNDACITSEKVVGKVSINTATKEELMTLSGIGEAKASDIITYREQNGLFENIEDIMKVPGIGENLFAAIAEDITV